MAWAFVQSTGDARAGATASSVHGIMFPAATIAGNALIGAAQWYSGAVQTSTWTDGQGNTWTELKNVSFTGNGVAMSVAWAPNIIGGSSGVNSSVTVHRGASTTVNSVMAVHEYSGLSSAHVSISNAIAGAQSTAASGLTSSNVTTTIGPCLLFGCCNDASNTSTNSWLAGTAFTARQNISTGTSTFVGLITEDQNQAVAGSTKATFQQKQAHAYSAILVTFGTTSAGGGATMFWTPQILLGGVM